MQLGIHDLEVITIVVTLLQLAIAIPFSTIYDPSTTADTRCPPVIDRKGYLVRLCADDQLHGSCKSFYVPTLWCPASTIINDWTLSSALNNSYCESRSTMRHLLIEKSGVCSHLVSRQACSKGPGNLKTRMGFK